MLDEAELEREIRTTAVDFSFGELLSLHTAGEIVIRPEYQRLFRWTNEQRSRLIESILLGLPIPPIFLIENEEGVLELIDGLQRISSVLQFLDNNAINELELVLNGCDILKTLNGITYTALPTIHRLKIKRSPIRATIINKSGDAAVKYEMFKRLNTGGSLLSSQEIRNCSSRMIEGGNTFYETVQEMAKLKSFTTTISRLPESYVEMRGDEELVLRFFAVVDYREGFKGNIEEWLDSYMEKVLFKNIAFNIDEQQNRFKKTFNLIHQKFSDKAFTRFNERNEATGRLAPAYFEAVVASVDANFAALADQSSDALIEKLRASFEDDDFKDATGPGANTITKLNQRIETVSRHLAGDANH